MQQRGATNIILIEGGRGIFEIRAAGQLLFSKAKSGHFPTDAELAALPLGGV